MSTRALLLLSALMVLGAAVDGCGGGAKTDTVAPPPVSADTLAAWLSRSREVVLFDDRADSLFDAGHIPGSVRVHGKTIPELRDVLPFGPDVPIVVVEDTDPGAASLARRLSAYGFPSVFGFEGGVEAWRRQGYQLDGYRIPLTRGGSPD